MGFYGNITNTSKTQFTFDRIYPNRFTLQNSMSTDGIYIGRFVLVEYDTSGLDFYKELYKGDPMAANNLPSAPVGKTYLYSSFKATDVGSIIKLGTTAEGNTVTNGQIVYYYVNRTTAEDVPASTWKVEFYKCVGGDTNGALFEQISSSEETNYLRNYNIDKEEFGDATNLSDIGRGWDSTVWQKVYSNGIEKYVMIAELNTVIPTFDIAADAPTMTPMTPHFDTDSTNVYYKLHAQPQWGFRVKSNENITGNPINEYGEELPGSINYSTDNTKYPSDEGTVWTRSEYNRKTGEEKTYYYNPDNKTWQDTEPTTKIPAAIYFNRAGFDSEFDTQSTDLTKYISAEGWDGKKDIINISPTGQSGHSYQDHNQKGVQSVQEDIQELSIILPSIGNSIAEMWNIVYGNRDDNATYNQEQGTHNKRNRDISWEDYDNEPDRKGLRLVRKKEDGNGFEYDQNQINTLAGCINSVHDLMGMIITNTVEEDIANTSSDKIYYQNGEYVFKHNKYFYNSDKVFTNFEPIIITKDDFNDNQYYIKNDDDEYIPAKNWDDNLEPNEQGLYIKVLNTVKNAPYTKIDLNKYENNKYYYKDAANNHYLIDEEVEFNPDKIYYNIPDSAIQKVILNDAYIPNTYYYKDNSGNYIKDIRETANTEINYYNVSTSIDSIYPSNGFKWFTNKNHYYIKPNPDINSYILVDNNDTFIPDEENGFINTTMYYEKQSIGSTEGTGGYVESIEYVKVDNMTQEKFNSDTWYELDESTGKFKPATVYIEGKQYFEQQIIQTEAGVTVLTWVPVSLVDYKSLIDAGKVLYQQDQSGNYIKAADNLEINIDNLTTTYCEIIVSDPLNTFYLKDKYYYKDEKNNIYLDLELNKTEGREYYSLNKDLILSNIQFYEKNKYYYLNPENQLYEIDNEDNYTLEREYFIRTYYYVKEDTRELFDQGSVWNTNVRMIPNSVTLSLREDSYELIPLTGFARTLNTINGLILEINHLIDFGCKTTRDTQTVQGCINVLNDIIAKFAELSPADILVVDSYGRLHGATHTTAQTFITTTSAIAHKAENNEDTNLVEDRWIYLNVNPDVLNPNITIEHRFNKVDDTETVSDLNAEASGCNGNNNLETESDILVLETPIVDNMGHVVGKNTETVTLPYGFKYFETDAWSNKDIDLYTTIVENDNGSFTETKQEPDSQVVKADTTQDKMKIDPVNKWIQMKYEDGEVEKLSIAHEIHGIEKSIKNKTDLNNPAVDEITIQDTEFDKAGHVIKNQNHTYILPYGYKHFQSNKISNNDQTDLDNAVNNGSSANNTQDTMNLNSANKWIQIAINEDITEVAHEIHDVNLEERNTNMNDGETVMSVNTFDNISLQDLVFDKAGHIIENHRHNYTLPYNIKFIDSNNTEASTSDAPASKGKLSATNTQDTFFIDPSNRWIKIDTSEAKTIRIGHSYAGNDEGRKYGEEEDQTPNFGTTFKVPYFGVDEAGHIKTQSEHTVKIPLPSLETFNANGYSVLTGIALDAPTGKFTYTTESIGKLKLNDYNLGSDYTSIAKEDTINEALSKLQNQINFIAGNDVDGLDSVKELVTWVNTHGAYATESFANINKLITDNETDIENKFTNLNDTTVKTEQYNAKISELEGIISNLTTQIQELKALVESYHPASEEIE